MPHQPCGRPLKGIQKTIPKSHTSQQCCVLLPTVNCIMPNPWECRAAKRTCTGICTSTNCCNTGIPNPPLRDSLGWYKSNAHSISENIPPKKPPKAARITTNLLSGHPPNHLPGQISAPSPQLPRAWEGLDSLLRPVPVPFKRLQNSPRPRQLRPSPPYQRLLKSTISV